MSTMLVIKGILLAYFGVGVIRGLHHFCLWLEERGLLYYKHRQPSGNAMSCLVGLQKAIAPSIQHVIQAKGAKRRQSEESANGEKQDKAPEPSIDSGA